MEEEILDMDSMMELAVEEHASDLHITVGVPPMLRIHGDLTPLDLPPLTPADTERLVRSICTEDQIRQVNENGGADFGLAFGDKARFRVSVLKGKGNYGTVLRQIPNDLLPLSVIGLPPQIEELLYKPRGLILVTGPTGSGKTTTLASMLNYINEKRACHIITIEDPIEYYHTHKSSVVTQREVGADVPSFSEALRRALRQDPDVILVGEMRDLETMQAAISAAETGHLVFGTLHTSSASQTIDRIIDVFPEGQQQQVRVQLSNSLVAVFSQTLLPLLQADGTKNGRVMAQEVMLVIPAIANLIREAKAAQIYSTMQTNSGFGMQTLEMALRDLYLKKMITLEDALARSSRPEEFKRGLQNS